MKVINNENDGSYVFKTILGWCIAGPVKSSQAKEKVSCNRTAVTKAGTSEIEKYDFEKRNYIAETDIKETLNRMYESDFT